MKAFDHYDIIFGIAECTESSAGPWDRPRDIHLAARTIGGRGLGEGSGVDPVLRHYLHIWAVVLTLQVDQLHSEIEISLIK